MLFEDDNTPAYLGNPDKELEAKLASGKLDERDVLAERARIAARQAEETAEALHRAQVKEKVVRAIAAQKAAAAAASKTPPIRHVGGKQQKPGRPAVSTGPQRDLTAPQYVQQKPNFADDQLILEDTGIVAQLKAVPMWAWAGVAVAGAVVWWKLR